MQLPLETEALVVHTPGGPFEMTPIVIQNLRPDEILVEMKYSGICHTDLWLQSGGAGPLVKFPVIPGHEGAGIIRAVGSAITRDSQSLRVGDAVLLSFAACGSCVPCREDQFSRCTEFTPLNLTGVRRPDGSSPAAVLLSDGSHRTETPVRAQFFGQSSFSRYSVVHEHCVVKCPYPEDLALYAPMGCGYQTGAGTILNIMKPRPEQTVAVFGAGSVGFAAIMAAAALSTKQIVAIDIVGQKLALARELGATHAINTAEISGGVVEEIRNLTGGKGVDFAIDTTGVASVVEQMLDCLAYGGTAASIGATPREAKITVDVGAFFAEKKTWIGVAEGDSHPPKFIPELINLHKQGKFPIESISKVYPVADLERAISDMKDGTVIKPIIRF
ncbi:chaperonin 10-like protein [Corynascus novoguineensis]|uniref:Chaperonin 10-like protein n=1 Tax=Corynascus novoguineensis TaxID=1126955 RepID=A0AAN7CXU5_9PEZI|nr:chaperonin 10-like protein [Corynascus novoguineensis]